MKIKISSLVFLLLIGTVILTGCGKDDGEAIGPNSFTLEGSDS